MEKQNYTEWKLAEAISQTKSLIRIKNLKIG